MSTPCSFIFRLNTLAPSVFKQKLFEKFPFYPSRFSILENFESSVNFELSRGYCERVTRKKVCYILYHLRQALSSGVRLLPAYLLS
jgi:hypothetical protein